MRCRNCHTVLMETDLECPCCHASMARATAAPPALSGGKPSPLLMLLPMFGGALGGLLYAGLVSASAPSVGTGWSGGTAGTRASSGSNPLKWLVGLVLMIVGGLFLVLATVHARETWKITQRQPTVATAAELCRKDYAASAPDWITYTFAEAKPTEVTVKRQRLGNGGEVEANCLLVRAEDQWLVATVAPGFEGNNLVGRLVPLDAPATDARMEQLRKMVPQPAALLPYEFNAVDGTASDQRLRYAAAAWIAVFGLLSLWLGRRLCRRGRRAQVTPWTFHPLPDGRRT